MYSASVARKGWCYAHSTTSTSARRSWLENTLQSSGSLIPCLQASQKLSSVRTDQPSSTRASSWALPSGPVASHSSPASISLRKTPRGRRVVTTATVRIGANDAVWCVRFQNSYFGVHVVKGQKERSRSLLFAFVKETDAMRFRNLLCNHYGTVGEWPSRIVAEGSQFLLQTSQQALDCPLFIDEYPFNLLRNLTAVENMEVTVVNFSSDNEIVMTAVDGSAYVNLMEIKKHLEDLFKKESYQK